MGGKTVDGGTREEHPLDRLASIPQSGPADRSKPSNAEHHRHYHATTIRYRAPPVLPTTKWTQE